MQKEADFLQSRVNGMDLDFSRRKMLKDAAAQGPLRVFILYSRKDAKLRDQLLKHFSSLVKRKRNLLIWCDLNIDAGDEWENIIEEKLETAHIFMPLISSDFIDSDYCHDKEMKRALERHNAGEALVVPVILRPCDWENCFGNFQVVPKSGKPIVMWKPRDSGYCDVVKRFRRIINRKGINNIQQSQEKLEISSSASLSNSRYSATDLPVISQPSHFKSVQIKTVESLRKKCNKKNDDDSLKGIVISDTSLSAPMREPKLSSFLWVKNHINWWRSFLLMTIIIGIGGSVLILILGSNNKNIPKEDFESFPPSISSSGDLENRNQNRETDRSLDENITDDLSYESYIDKNTMLDDTIDRSRNSFSPLSGGKASGKEKKSEQRKTRSPSGSSPPQQKKTLFRNKMNGHLLPKLPTHAPNSSVNKETLNDKKINPLPFLVPRLPQNSTYPDEHATPKSKSDINDIRRKTINIPDINKSDLHDCADKEAK